LELPNVLQHVMARGIEGREIFRDEKMSALGRLYGFAHTSVREATERVHEERDEVH